VHDPTASPEEAEHEYGVRLKTWEQLPKSVAIVLAVAHAGFTSRPVEDFVGKLAPNGVFIDVKAQADLAALSARGITVWRL
jgi:UDP-N-acetyl-D-galactosamine dehydrogenase